MLGSALRVPVKNNDEDGILKTEERLMKKVIPKGHQVETYRKFHDAEYLRSIGMATQIQEQREKNAILDSFEDGVEQGIKQGCSTWLFSLSMEQLDLVSNLLFTCDTLQKLKNQPAVHK